MRRNPPRDSRDSTFSKRRAELYAAAYNAGLSQAAADDWVHQHLYRRRRGDQDKTPTLFGTFLARESLAAQKGQVQR